MIDCFGNDKSFKDYYSPLSALHQNRIFSVDFNGSKFTLREQCDSYFAVDFTPEEFLLLIEDMKKFYHEMANKD